VKEVHKIRSTSKSMERFKFLKMARSKQAARSVVNRSTSPKGSWDLLRRADLNISSTSMKNVL